MAKRKTLGEILRDQVQRSGLSIAQIAREAGITQPALSRFVNGRRGLTLDSADLLAAYFQLELRPKTRRST